MFRFVLFVPIDLGYLPEMISEDDPRPVKDQLNERYAHGGGYDPLPGWVYDPKSHSIKYPGDPALRPLATGLLHGGMESEELLFFYESDWLCIVQKDGSYAVTRVD